MIANIMFGLKPGMKSCQGMAMAKVGSKVKTR